MRADGRQRLNVLGIDVGGTKVAAARIGGSEVLDYAERPTELSSGEALLDGIEAAVARCIAADGRPDGVGVGVPSQVDFATGTSCPASTSRSTGVPLREELGRRLGVPVFVDNDANVAALGEAKS